MATVNFRSVQTATEQETDQYIQTMTRSYRETTEDINAEIQRYADKYGTNGVLTYDDLAKMDPKERKRVSRMNSLTKQIEADLVALEKDELPRLNTLINEVYKVNVAGTGALLGDFTGSGVFDMINRGQVYNSAINPMDNLSGTLNREALEAIGEHSDEVAGIVAQNTARAISDIRRAITTSITSGEGIDKMQRRITERMEMSANRALRIARTETNAMANIGRLQAFETAQSIGLRVIKEWSSTNDDRTRASHAMLNHQVEMLEDKFANGLMYPCDMSGPASEVVNCRCSLVSDLLDYDFDGKLINGVEAEDFEDRDKYLKAELKKYNSMVRDEPKITKVIRDLESKTGMKADGLDFRVKDVNSYLRKVNNTFKEAKAKYGDDFMEHLYTANDVVRYTYLQDADNLVDGFMETRRTFEAQGYEFTKIRNAWMEMDDPYCGINTNMISPNGTVFELQFHTPEAFELKNGVAHELYREQEAFSVGSDTWWEFQQGMYELYDTLERPKNIELIVSMRK